MNEKRRKKIIAEIAAFFIAGVIITGVLTYLSETGFSQQTVTKQTETHAEQIAEEVRSAVKEFPAYIWLFRYWYNNADELDIEYDALLTDDTETAEKCRILQEHNPGINLRYMTHEQCAGLPEEDQKLYAEVAYSWLLTRINEIKNAYHIDFVFCVISEPPYDEQFFLISGAEPGAVRGTSYEEAYLLGHVVTVSKAQSSAMYRAVKDRNHLADAGKYVDYYTLLCRFDNHYALIGLTFGLSDLQADVALQTKEGATFAIITQIVLSVICLLFILVFVVRPVKRVQAGVRNYQKTKDSKAVKKDMSEIKTKNEIGQLAVDISQLADEIDSYTDEIRTMTADNERISTELSLATRIQEDMLPNTFPAFPEQEGFDIYASMEPAKEVGGDFYDFFLIDDNHLCMIIADVSGKGVPAALFMMAAKIILDNNSMMGKSPAQILTDTNSAICSHNREEMFVTTWLGILEISTGKLTAANAGHEYPIIKKPDGKFELFKDKHGFVIGGMDGLEYTEYEMTLEPGSKLFVYTDGAPEATDADGEMFGTDRLVEALNTNPDASPEQLIKNVDDAVAAFVKDAEQFDDLTMLCLEYGKDGGRQIRH